MRAVRGITASQAALVPQLAGTDLIRTMPRLDIAVVLAQGRLDQVAPAELTQRFHDSLSAPAKRLVWFELLLSVARDGTRWHFMARLQVVTQLLLELEAKPGKQRGGRLVVTDEGVDVSGTAFRWPDVTRILHRAIDQHVNGSYLHTTFTIGVGDAKHTATFMMVSGTTGALKTKIDHATRTAFHERWGQAVELIDRYAGVRVVTEAVAAVRRGGAVEMSGLRLDPRGVHKPGLFGGKSIAWAEYAGVKHEQSYVHLLAQDGDKSRSRIHVINSTWNIALLPRVLQELRTSAA